ncbi:MAG: HugZ family protein [Acidobacteriota bacterium]|nr:MAG: HugZ family protein [Acidobacteriota bacterium]
MEDKTPEHARPTAATEPAVPEPTYAERAKTLLYVSRVGTLSTVSQKVTDFPFGSVAPYGLDERGCPTFLISTMAMHTQNILGNDRASLLVTEANVAEDPLGAGRVTLVGHVAKTPESALAYVREEYLARYENASYWVDFKDFAFFQMDVIEVYFVGGFGVMGWVSAGEYLEAEPDPLADTAAGIIDHMNEDHVEAMLLLARGIAGVEAEDAKMTAVDRLGFHVRLTTADGMRGVRIPFTQEVRSGEQTRAVLVEMVQKQRNS